MLSYHNNYHPSSLSIIQRSGCLTKVGGPTSGSFKKCRDWFLYRGTLEDTSKRCLEEGSVPSHPLCEELHRKLPESKSSFVKIKSGKHLVDIWTVSETTQFLCSRYLVICVMLTAVKAGVLSARRMPRKANLDIAPKMHCR